MLASDVYQVSTLEDVAVYGTATDDLWSLQEALADSAADDDGIDTIEFDPSLAGETITLTGQLSIDSDVVIDAGDAPGLTISGGGTTRLFSLSNDASATVRDLTLADGSSSVSHHDGGAIYSLGDLTVERVDFLNNSVPDNGGAIYAQSGTLHITDSEFVGNSGEGGAIHINQPQVLTVDIERSTFESNTSSIGGGAILITGSRTHGDHIRITNSTFTDNESRYSGGAIGGSNIGSLEVYSSTIVGNRSTESYAGGIGTWQSDALVLQNTIVSQNTSHTHSSNLYANNSLSGLSGGNYVNGDPILKPIGEYGGSTRTMPPRANSPVIDAGDDSLTVPIVDQRDLNRLVDLGDTDNDGSFLDIGAYERQVGEAIVVNTVKDGSTQPGEVTLREAIAIAAAIPGPDTIRFDNELFASSNPNDPPLSVARSIVLGDTDGDGTSDTLADQLLIDSELTIAGPGSELLTIDAAGNSRVLRVNAGATTTLKDLTVTGGSVSSGGAGAYALGDLTLERTVWTGNSTLGSSSSKGGAIFAYNADLKAYDSTFDDNKASRGGGIYFQSYIGGELVVSRSTISNNELVSGTNGSGLTVYSYSASTVEIVNSTVSGNVGSQGGAVTIFGNSSLDVDIINSTIAYNEATSHNFPAGLWDYTSSGVTTLTNSIVAHNYDDSDGPYREAYDIRGHVVGTHNVLGHSAIAGFSDGVDSNVVIDVDGGDSAGLMPLGQYGGYAETHKLDAVSISKGVADPQLAPMIDARYVSRSDATQTSSSTDAGAVVDGDTIYVTTHVDNEDADNDLSLREAIRAANNNNGVAIKFSRNHFSNPRTILLGDTNGDGLVDITPRAFIISSDVSINWEGDSQLTVDGGGYQTAFLTILGTTHLSGMTLKNTSQYGVENRSGFLVLSDMLVTEHNGVAVSSRGGALSITDSVISQSLIGVSSFDSTVTLEGTTVENNGRGIGNGVVHVAYNTNAKLDISNSAILNNTGELGAGVYAYTFGLSLGVFGFSVGPGIADVEISNSTISGNKASSDGGGIRVIGADLDIRSSTIVDNQAGSFAGGIDVQLDERRSNPTAYGSAFVANTLIAGNWSGDTQNLQPSDLETEIAFDLQSGSNIIGTTSAGSLPNGTGNIPVAVTNTGRINDLGLLPLGHYGGLSPSHALTPSSVAVDAGTDSLTTNTTDQRGHARVVDFDERGGVGANIDIGAFELEIAIESPEGFDVNGDGREDVIFFDTVTGATAVEASSSQGIATRQQWNSLDPSKVWQHVAVADLNGDNRDDLLVKNAAGDLWVQRSETTLFDALPLLDRDGNAVSANDWNEDHLYVGDFDADGSEEIAVRNASGTSWKVLHYSDTLPTHVEDWGNALHGHLTGTIHVGDGNRDGRDDLIVKGSDDDESDVDWRVALSQPTNGGEFLDQNWGDWFDKAGASTADGTELDPDAPYAAVLDAFKSVYDTVELELYNGFLKGTKGVQNSGGGNAYDQAAYLEEKLESLGFAAELVVGTATAKWEEVRDWIGAPELLVNSRASTLNVLSLYDSSAAVSGADDLSFGHAWVKIDAPTPSSSDAITLDPSWKFKDRQPGKVRNGGALWRGWDYRDALALNNNDPGSDANIYVEDLGSPVDAYSVAVTQALIDSNEFGFSSSDVAYDGPIRPWTNSVLPWGYDESSPTKVETTRFESIGMVLGSAADSEAYAHRIEIALSRLDTAGDIDEASTSVGVLVPTASADAEGILITYNGDVPQLQVGAATPVSGPSIGVDENLVVETRSYAPGQNYSTPDSETTSYSYAARRHDTVALGVGANQHGALSLAEKAEQLQTTLSTPDVSEIADFLHYTLDLLLEGIYVSHERVGSFTNYGLVTEAAYLAIASSSGSFNADIESAGFAPFGVAPERLSINAGDTSEPFRLFAWHTTEPNQQLGHLLSTERAYLENAVIEETIAAESVSSLKAAQRSIRAGSQTILQYWMDKGVQLTANGSFVTGDRIGYIPWIYSNGSWNNGPANSNSFDEVRGGSQFGRFVNSLLADTHLGSTREDGLRYASEIVSTLFHGDEFVTSLWVPQSAASVGEWQGNSYSASGAFSGRSFYSARLLESGSVASDGGASSDDSSFADALAFPSNLSRSASGGVSVDPTSGAARLTERDIQLASAGVPLDFVRYYSSHNDEHVGLGVGWSHSFSDRLVHAGGSGMEPDLEWIDSRGARHLFTYDNVEGYQTPSELFGTLVVDLVNDEYVFLADDGMRTRFEKAGLSATTQHPTVARLKSKLTLGKDGYELTYNSATSTQIAEVRDVHFNAERKLHFSYSPTGYIEAVTKHDFQDATALESGVSSNIGTWEYVYDTASSSQLEKVKSPTDTHITTSLETDYAYHDNSAPTKVEGKLKRVTDPNDVPIELAYYPNGLVQKVVNDPDGSDPSAMRYRYNLVERRTTITDENGSSESVLYNDNGLVTRVIHADGSQRSTQWGVVLNGDVVEGTEYLVSSETNELGARHQTSYFLNLQEPIEALNRKVLSTVGPHYYHSAGTRLGVEQPRKTYDYTQVSTDDYSHAVLPRRIKETIGQGADEVERETELSYDEEGRLASSTVFWKTALGIDSQRTTYDYFNDDGYRNNLVSDVHSGAGRSEDDGILEFLTLFDDVEVVSNPNGLGTLAVTLLGASDNATKRLYADAVRVYRVGEPSDTTPFGGNTLDVLDIRTIDDSDATSFSVAGTTSPGAEQSSAFGDTVTELDPGGTATWTFSDLVPGRYRIAVSLDRDTTSDSDSANYEVRDGDGVLLDSVVGVSLANPPAEDVHTNRQQSFAYDAAGRVTQSSIEGIPVGFSSYDPNGNLLESIERTGVRTGGEYDALGRRQAAFQGDAANSVDELTTTYSYDAARLQSMTDALDRQTVYGYDNRGRLVTTTNALGETVTQQFDDAGNLIASADALGNTTEYRYDARNRRIQTIHPDGAVETTFYDAVGRIRRQVDALGQATDFEYDVAGNPVRTKRYLVEGDSTTTVETTTVWDGFGNLLQTIDPEGHVSQTYYDGRGQAIKTLVYDENLVSSQGLRDNLSLKTLSSADKPIVFSTSKYNAAGELVETRVYDTVAITEAGASFNPTLLSPMGSNDSEYWQEVQFAYDSLGRRTDTMLIDASAVLGGANPTTRSIYDSAGRVRYQIDELGRVTEQTYDEYGRAEETVAPAPTPDDGSDDRPRTINSYDAVGNLISVVDANGGVATIEYDSLNRPIATTNAEGETTRTLYDEAGRVVASVDPRGFATHTVYDSRGRVVQTRNIDPDGSSDRIAAVTRFSYDAAGRLIEEIDPLGYTTTHKYDTLNRRDESSVVISLTADDRDPTFDRVEASDVAVETPEEKAFSHTLTTVSSPLPDSPIASWSFSNLSAGKYRVFVPSASLSEAAIATVLFDDNPQSGLESVALGTALDADAVHRFDAGDSHLWIEITSSSNLLDVQELGVATIRLRGALGGSVVADAVRLERLAKTTTQYDLNGNLTHTSDLEGRVTTRQYDEVNRLSEETLPDTGNGSLSTESRYDGYGNLIQTIEKHAGSPYRITKYEYDARNRLTLETQDYDDGIPLSARGDDEVSTRYEYDDAGRLVRQLDAVGTEDEVITEYAYDDLDRVIEESIDIVPRAGEPTPNSRAGNATQLTTYGYDTLGNRTRVTDYAAGEGTAAVDTISVYDKANRLVSVTTGSSTDRFWYDANGDLIAQSDATDILNTYELDRLGRTVAVVSHDQDGGDPLRTELAYDPVGNLTEETIVADLPSNNETTRSFYDSLGRLVRSVDGEGNVTLSSYDAVGNLTTYVDPLQNKTIYEYDDLNRLTVETDSFGYSRTYTYDDRGRLATAVDRNGRERRFSEYDNLDRLKIEEWGYADLPGSGDRGVSHTIAWEYDLLGRNTYASEFDIPTGERVTETFEYDNLGRLTKQRNFDDDLTAPAAGQDTGYATVITASQRPQVTQEWTRDQPRAGFYSEDAITQKVGETLVSSLDYAYDNRGRLSQIEDQPEGRTFSFAYDAADRLDALTRSWGTHSFDTNYGYDGLGRLELVEHSVGSNAAFAGFNYTYDHASRIETAFESYTFSTAAGPDHFSRLKTYQYDKAGQSTQLQTDLQPHASLSNPLHENDESTTYDANGNRSSTEGASISQNRLVEDNGYKYGYDPEGNLAWREDRSSGTVTQYTWDHRNRLSRVREYDTPSLELSDATVFAYNFTNPSTPDPGHWRYVDGNRGVELYGNIAIAIDLAPYSGSSIGMPITRDTVIEFDYISRETDAADFQGIGFENDLNHGNSHSRQIRLDGTNSAVATVPTTYSESEGVKSYRIKLEDFFGIDYGEGEHRYLFLRNWIPGGPDSDQWGSRYSNIRIYQEPTDRGVKADFSTTSLDNVFFGQTGGTATFSDNGDTLDLDATQENVARYIDFPKGYIPTKDTILAFDYLSHDEPSRVAIGLTDDNQPWYWHEGRRTVFIDGVHEANMGGNSELHNLGDTPGYDYYSNRGQWQTFELRLGDFSHWDVNTHASYERTKLIAWAQKDDGFIDSAGDAHFRNVRLYEKGAAENLEGKTSETRFTYNASDQLISKDHQEGDGLALSIDFGRSDLNQDWSGETAQNASGATVEVLDDGATIRLEGNVVRAIDLPREYYVTDETVIRFEYRSGAVESRVVGIGILDPVEGYANNNFVAIDGWEVGAGQPALSDYDQLLHNDGKARGEDGWVSFELRAGDYPGLDWSGKASQRLALLSDNQYSPTANDESYFRNIEIFEDDKRGPTGMLFGQPSEVTTEHYVYTGSQRTLKLDDEGEVLNRYLYGPGQDQLILDEAFDDQGDSDERWAVTDHLGTVHRVLDENAQLEQHIDYDQFGQIAQLLDPSGQKIETPTGEPELDQLATDIAFAGREWENDLGLYHNRARWYDAGSGRFISEDPLGFADGPNPYRYAGNDPVSFRDPTGLFFDYFGSAFGGFNFDYSFGLGYDFGFGSSFDFYSLDALNSPFDFSSFGGFQSNDIGFSDFIFASENGAPTGSFSFGFDDRSFVPSTFDVGFASDSLNGFAFTSNDFYDGFLGPLGRGSSESLNPFLDPYLTGPDAAGRIARGVDFDIFRDVYTGLIDNQLGVAAQELRDHPGGVSTMSAISQEEADRGRYRYLKSTAIKPYDQRVEQYRLEATIPEVRNALLLSAAQDLILSMAGAKSPGPSGLAGGPVAVRPTSSTPIGYSGRLGITGTSTKPFLKYPAENGGSISAPTLTTLPVGTLIDRYGPPTGRYASPAGINFVFRSLPELSSQYRLHTYRVIRPLEVEAGRAAPWFSQPGLGEQYLLPNRVYQLEGRFIEEVFP